MVIGRDLNGLIKFMRREGWRDHLADVMDEHFGPALEETGLDFEELGEIIGEDWLTSLWGNAFEDAMSREADDGRNPVDDYLKRRGWKESAAARAYMQALRASVPSLYEVSEVKPGQSLMARDLLRGGAPILVREKSATKTLQAWQRIAVRIVALDEGHVLAGGVLAFSKDAEETLIAALRAVAGKSKRSRAKPQLTDAQLREAAPLFTLAWLAATLPQFMEQELPEIRNSDGDVYELHEVRFPLVAGTRPDEVAARLDAIPGFERASDSVWNWLEASPRKRAAKGGRDKGRESGTAISYDVTMDSGVPVLGTVEVKDDVVALAVNSSQRARRGEAVLKQALGSLARAPLTSIQTVEQLMAERPRRSAPQPSGLTADQEAEVIHAALERHYHETLDQPVSMLGGKTPRAAARTRAGRVKVADWLKYLELQSSRLDRSDPMAGYDFGWMWAELKVEDLRK